MDRRQFVASVIAGGGVSVSTAAQTSAACPLAQSFLTLSDALVSRQRYAKQRSRELELVLGEIFRALSVLEQKRVNDQIADLGCRIVKAVTKTAALINLVGADPTGLREVRDELRAESDRVGGH